jgi:thiamine-monophosphate kinase
MKDLGEKLFISQLLPRLIQDKSFVNGFGHDASIVDIGLEKNIAFKIDRAAKPVLHGKNSEWFKVWGRLAVVANVSDLLAVGAQPKAFMVSIIVPGHYDSESVTDIIEGCQEYCDEANISFVGGDTKEGLDAQVIGASFGIVNRARSLGRVVANPGDKLVIAGQLGGFAGAYELIKSTIFDANLLKKNELLKYISYPKAQLFAAPLMSSSNLASGACDLSDGLADVLNNFCNDSVGIKIDASLLPIHKFAFEAEKYLGLNPCGLAFGVGDWAIAFILPSDKISSFESNFKDNNLLKIVGEFTSENSRKVLYSDGSVTYVPNIINEHFRDRLEDESSDYSNKLSLY